MSTEEVIEQTQDNVQNAPKTPVDSSDDEAHDTPKSNGPPSFEFFLPQKYKQVIDEQKQRGVVASPLSAVRGSKLEQWNEGDANSMREEGSSLQTNDDRTNRNSGNRRHTLSSSAPHTPEKAEPAKGRTGWSTSGAAASCELCGYRFGLIHRRHHCRACQRAVCGSCSPNRMSIEKGQKAVRVCDKCYAQLRKRTEYNTASMAAFSSNSARSIGSGGGLSPRGTSETNVEQGVPNAQADNTTMSVRDYARFTKRSTRQQETSDSTELPEKPIGFPSFSSYFSTLITKMQDRVQTCRDVAVFIRQRATVEDAYATSLRETATMKVGSSLMQRMWSKKELALEKDHSAVRGVMAHGMQHVTRLAEAHLSLSTKLIDLSTNLKEWTVGKEQELRTIEQKCAEAAKKVHDSTKLVYPARKEVVRLRTSLEVSNMSAQDTIRIVELERQAYQRYLQAVAIAEVVVEWFYLSAEDAILDDMRKWEADRWVGLMGVQRNMNEAEKELSTILLSSTTNVLGHIDDVLHSHDDNGAQYVFDLVSVDFSKEHVTPTTQSTNSPTSKVHNDENDSGKKRLRVPSMSRPWRRSPSNTVSVVETPPNTTSIEPEKGTTEASTQQTKPSSATFEEVEEGGSDSESDHERDDAVDRSVKKLTFD